jgi:hypothetical protein
MEDYEQKQENNNFLTQIALPNATAALVLGIISIVFSCCCIGIIGVIFGIIGLLLSIQATKLYTGNPHNYTASSYKNANAGKICSIIGLVIGLIMFIALIANWSSYMEIFEQIRDGSFDPSMYY